MLRKRIDADRKANRFEAQTFELPRQIRLPITLTWKPVRAAAFMTSFSDVP